MNFVKELRPLIKKSRELGKKCQKNGTTGGLSLKMEENRRFIQTTSVKLDQFHLCR